MSKRFDGRDYDQIRKMEAKVGIIPNANGSAIFKFGNTYALAAVYGPRAIPKSLGEYDKAVLRVRYNMLTFSVPNRKRPNPSRREVELSEVIKRSLEPALFLEEFPGAVVDIYIDILQADAGTRTAGINAASLALADAGILMKDLVVSVAVGKIGERVVIDLTKEEEDYDSEVIKQDPNLKEFYEYYGEGRATDIPVAMIPLTKEFTSIQMDGEISKKELKEALSLAMSKAHEIRAVLEKAIIEKYKEVGF